jgi:predicted dehydrogenase
VAKGNLGEIIKVVCEYPQGYAITALTGEDKAIANWRANPKIGGISNCMGDIGTHAENLVHYITGLEIDKLCADLSVNIPGRTLDDDGNVLVRFKGGAKGIIYASQVSNGDENDLNIRIYGTKQSLEWHQEDPNDLISHSVIPKVLLRPLRTSTMPQPLRSMMKWLESSPVNQGMIFLISATGSSEWHSLRLL